MVGFESTSVSVLFEEPDNWTEKTYSKNITFDKDTTVLYALMAYGTNTYNSSFSVNENDHNYIYPREFSIMSRNRCIIGMSTIHSGDSLKVSAYGQGYGGTKILAIKFE